MATTCRRIGDGSVTGATKGWVVEARKNIRVKVLNKQLLGYRPKSMRAVWSWRQRDKVSSAWIPAIPAPDNMLTNAEFSQAAAIHLCLPSPSYRDLVGEHIKNGVVVDQYRDSVQATSVPGDHWRTRHNAFLHMIHRLCLWSGLPVQMEVFNLFSGLVTQPGLSRAEKVHMLQGLVPDLRTTLPGAGVTGRGGLVGDRAGAPGRRALTGQVTSVFHKVKVISSSQSCYKPTW